jgi:alkanesulfonate monooxygenase SsuD/methylene tetrahydromethanopterin reductase-like flavin-dependent oxidoreductase (luciferase family)
MEFGLFTFGDLTPRRADRGRIGAREHVQEILVAAALADEAGFEVFVLGEHDRLDMAVVATPVVLAELA